MIGRVLFGDGGSAMCDGERLSLVVRDIRSEGDEVERGWWWEGDCSDDVWEW